MLQINQLNQYYADSHTLWDVDLHIEKGLCTCLMGRNGVGKTTLLECIMGLRPIKSGQILFNGTTITKMTAEKRATMGIGYVPQGRQIFPLLTIKENLQVSLSAKRSKKGIPSLIFDLFPVLKDMLNRKGGDLSGGQQQQLAIGRALVLNPTLLILDEPTEGIQPNIVQEIATIIRQLNQNEGLTVLLVEQKLPFIKKIADKFCILDRGRSVANGDMPLLNNELIQKYLTV